MFLFLLQMDRRRKAQRPHSQSQHTGQEGTNPKVGSKDSVSASCVSISASNHMPSCKSKLGKHEACSGLPQTPLSLGKSQEVLSKCRSCWLQLVWSPLCLKAGASEAQASIFFFTFIKVHFHPFIGCAVFGTGWALRQCQTAGL